MNEEMWCFDPVTLAFYPYSMKSDYVAAGSWPKNGVDVTSYVREDFQYYNAPTGMTIGANSQGHPCWVPIEAPKPPTEEELYMAAEIKRKSLIAETEAIPPIVWAAMGDEGTVSKDQKAWIDYRQALKDLSKQPNYPNVTWPVKPELP
jgi:Phage tail assembly chaperone protein